MRTIGGRVFWAWTFALVAVSGGCGNGTPRRTGPRRSPGRKACVPDVVATLTGNLGLAPSKNSFTLVLDLDARRAIVGGNGRGTVVNLTSIGGPTFRAAAGFAVGGIGGQLYDLR